MPYATTMVAAPLAILFAALGLRLSLLRRSKRIFTGMSGDADFIRLQRAHGNAAEHIPVVLVLSLLGELGATPHPVVLALGGLFLLARVLHAGGMIGRRPPLHVTGAALTYVVEIAWGCFLLANLVRR